MAKTTQLDTLIWTLPTNPFYELTNVELEVSFALDAKAGVKAKLIVIELNGETKATQVHKVKLQLTPLKTNSDKIEENPKTSTSGGGGYSEDDNKKGDGKFDRPSGAGAVYVKP